MIRWHRGLRLPLALFSALLLGAGLLVLGSSADSSPAADLAPAVNDPAQGSLPPGTAGMRYSLNTGEEVLGAAQAPLELDEETRNALRRDEEGLVPVTHPDGSVSVHLQGRFQSASIARIGPDGKITVCVDDPAQVGQATSAPATKWEEQ